MKKKTKRRLKKILALGILGAGAKMGMSKMAENAAIKKRAMEAGCDDYDTKPVEIVRLLEKINKQLNKNDK